MTRSEELRVEIGRLQAELAAIENGTWEALGVGPLTAQSLAGRQGISDQAANNRLSALVDHGLAVRTPEILDGGGKRYLYARADRGV